MIIKRGILIILLAAGVLLIGSGVWLLNNVVRAKVTIPVGNPVIYEKLDYIMRGQFTYMYIYDDGSIIYIEEKGLRLQLPGHPPTRTWKTGKLAAEKLESLLAYFESSGLDKLDEHYNFPGEPIAGGGFRTGGMGITLTVKHGNLNKTVTAFGYLTPDQGETYPDMPSPLDDIYVKLRAIALGTQEVARENIS